MKATIRIALEQDKPEWVRMRHALWPQCSPERHELEIQQLTASRDGGVVLVAVRQNGSLCGFAEWSIRHDHVDAAASVPVAYLEGWYVDSDVRRAGIGRRLLEAVERWAVARGLKELASDVELDNQEGIQVHCACGFRETCRAVHFIKPISVNPNEPGRC